MVPFEPTPDLAIGQPPQVQRFPNSEPALAYKIVTRMAKQVSLMYADDLSGVVHKLIEDNQKRNSSSDHS